MCGLGCQSAQLTELVVEIHTDLNVPSDADFVRLEVFGTNSASDKMLSVNDNTDFPLSATVFPSSNNLSVTLSATALKGGTPVVSQTRTVMLERDRSLYVRLLLSATCADGSPECPDAEQTCHLDTCINTLTTPLALGEGRGALKDCVFDSGCNDEIACTSDVCKSGVCVHSANDSACTAATGGRCEPTGCQYDICDQSTCPANDGCFTNRCEGNICVRESTCQAGQECCGTTCVAAGCSDGIECTFDSCDGTQCLHFPSDIRCDDNNECTADSCDVTAGCLNPFEENGTPCDDGIFCKSGDTCNLGSCIAGSVDSCGTLVCNEASKSCEGCSDDNDCPDDMNIASKCEYPDPTPDECSRPDLISTTRKFSCNMQTQTCESTMEDTTTPEGCMPTLLPDEPCFFMGCDGTCDSNLTCVPDQACSG